MRIRRAEKNSTRSQISQKMQEKGQIVAHPTNPYPKIAQRHNYTKRNWLGIHLFLTENTINATRKACRWISINKSKKSCQTSKKSRFVKDAGRSRKSEVRTKWATTLVQRSLWKETTPNPSRPISWIALMEASRSNISWTIVHRRENALHCRFRKAVTQRV